MQSDAIAHDTADVPSHANRFNDSPSWYKLALPFSERRLLLFVGDIALLALAVLAAIWSRSIIVGSAYSLQMPSRSEAWLFALAGIWIIFAVVNECYDVKRAARPMRILRSLLVTAVGSGLVYLLIFFFLGRPAMKQPWPLSLLNVPAPPRTVPIFFLVIAFALIAAWRIGYVSLFTRIPLRRRVLIIGAGWAGETLMHSIKQLQDYEIVGFIDDDPTKREANVAGVPVVGDRHNLVQQVEFLGADEIVLAVTGNIHSDLFRALMTCYEQGITIKPMPLIYEETLNQIPVEHLGQNWFPAPLWNTSYTPTLYRIVKRCLDVVLALVGLTLLIPVFPIVALAVYLDNPGPIFYTQERLGKGGRSFNLIKFRSMIPDAERGGQAVWATEADDRITRVGKLLRRTRIDEFPQLLNVLKGEMSIVGPRPERPEFVKQLQEDIPFYRARLSVKPGLTGWAQIKYRYGNTVEGSRIKLQYDLYYLKHRSLLLDLLIILRTIKVMVLMKGT